MTKILYIPHGKYLHFNLAGYQSTDMEYRTCIFEESQWYHNLSCPANDVIMRLTDKPSPFDNHDQAFKTINELPNTVYLEEFELID